jgi:hypothetical protein
VQQSAASPIKSLTSSWNRWYRDEGNTFSPPHTSNIVVPATGTELLMSLQEFSLPTTITTLVAQVNGKHIVHCLDFDLVETGASPEEAWSRLTLTIKSYVEFGLGKGWGHSIRHRAPQRFWDAVTEDLPVRFRAPIKIANVTVPVIKVEEPRYEALAAAGSA